MGKASLVRKVAAWALCALLACSVAPTVALAGSGGDAAGAEQGLAAGAGQELVATGQPGKAHFAGCGMDFAQSATARG